MTLAYDSTRYNRPDWDAITLSYSGTTLTGVTKT